MPSMSRPTLERITNDAAASLANRAAYLPDVWAALDDMQAGYPSGGGGGGGEPASVPERLTVQHLGGVGDDGRPVPGYPDRAATDAATLTRLLADVATKVWLIDDIYNRWLVPTAEKPVLGRDNWCANHLLIKHPVARGARTGDLCAWCANFKSANKYLPTVELLDMHDRGIRINMAHIEQYRPRKAKTKTPKPPKQPKAPTRQERLADRLKGVGDRIRTGVS